MIRILKDKEFLKKHKFKLVNITIATLLTTTLLSSCKAAEEEYEETVYEPGNHQISEVKRNIDLLFGKEGKIGLIAPQGYKVVDYDYDKFQSLEYQDFLYVNDEPVSVTNPNDFGTSLEIINRSENTYLPGQHVISDISRNVNLWIGKDETKEITAPQGYKLLDYDYDKADSLEFETYTYANEVTVQTDDINEYGTVINDYETNNGNIRQPGQHTIARINRNINLWIGKDETKEITAPPGYKIVDYDYDKGNGWEFETIVYENIVPVEITDNNSLGTPIDYEEETYNNTRKPGTHVLVDIQRGYDLFLGKEGKKQEESPQGYELIDYDYDRNESFEFETRVYINSETVTLTDNNTFGEAQKVLTK